MRAIVMALVLSGTLLTAGAWAQETPRICIVNLDKAINGTPVVLYLAFEGGACRRAFALAPRYNKPSHLVDPAGLSLKDGKLTGAVKVTLRADHWVPKDGKPVACEYALEITTTDAALAGTYKGRTGSADVSGDVTGTTGPEQTPKLAVAWLDFFHPTDARPRGGHPAVELVLRDGAIVAAQFVDIPSSPTHHGSYDVMDKHSLRLERGVLSGLFTGREIHPGGAPEIYDCQIEGALIAGAAGGTLTVKLANGKTAKTPFWGRVEAAVEPPLGECVFEMLLHNAVPKEQMVEFRVGTRGGSFGRGVGITTVNRGSAEVDAAGLKLEGDRITGKIDLVVNVDDWIPTDRKPVPGSYTIDAKVKDLMVLGTLKGTAKGEEVSGMITGRIRPHPEPKEKRTGYCKLLKGINGLTGGYISVSFEVADGKTKLNHFPVAADVASVVFKQEGDAMHGAINCTMKQGPYQGKPMLMEFKAPLVGGWMAGDLTISVEGKVVANEKFFGSM